MFIFILQQLNLGVVILYTICISQFDDPAETHFN